MTEGGCGFDVCGLKYTSHRYRFVYFEVPNTGTRSLLHLLAEHAVITRMKRRLDFLEYPDYLKFAFVRNPWDRILSCYLNKIMKDQNFQNKGFKNGVMRKFHKFNVFYAGMPFDEFVHAVRNIPDEIADGHLPPSTEGWSWTMRSSLTTWARYENFREAISNFLRTVGLDVVTQVPYRNKSERWMPYTEYYNTMMKPSGW